MPKLKKSVLIDRIKECLKTTGAITMRELNAECSPLHFSQGNQITLIERLYDTEAELITYLRDEEIGERKLPYEEITNKNLQEILDLLNLEILYRITEENIDINLK